MNLRSYKWLLVLLLSLLYFAPQAWQSNVAAPSKPAIPALPSFRTGDLVVIRGNSFFSDQIRQLNVEDKRYSHCGWVVQEADSTFVYHLLGGAGRQSTPIQRTPIREFIGPGQATEWGVYRFAYADSNLLDATRQIKEWRQQGVSFDYQFDLASDEKMYCSELIFKALKCVEEVRIMVNLANVKSRTYVSIDKLYLNPKTTKFFDYAYH